MKVKFLDGRMTSKGKAKPGDVLDLSDQEAAAAIMMEAAEAYHPAEKATFAAPAASTAQKKGAKK